MDTRDPIDDRRQARRFRAHHLAKIVVEPDIMITCLVEDISTGGARISLDGRHHVPDEFDLFIAAHELQVHRVHVRWRRADALGVMFIRASDEAQSHNPLADELARIEVEVEREEGAERKVPSRSSA